MLFKFNIMNKIFYNSNLKIYQRIWKNMFLIGKNKIFDPPIFDTLILNIRYN